MLFIVCAHLNEAKPLIRHFKCKYNSESSHFPIYENEQIKCIISGIGKVSSAAATSYLFGKFAHKKSLPWINIGIAGHKSHEIGSGFLAHKIRDQSINYSSYPSMVFTVPCKTLEVITVDKPEITYPEDCLYEMEASGFYQTAMRFSSCELIHVYKIVSDNAKTGFSFFKEKNIIEMIEKNLPSIEKIITSLISLSQKVPNFQTFQPEVEKCLKKWHFTQSQKIELQKLFEKWHALSNDSLLDSEMQMHSSAKEVLFYCKQKLNRLPI